MASHAALKGILNKDGIADAIAAQADDEEDDDLSEEAKAAIRQQMLQRARQPNLSFFAFTATPKFKTKMVFDEPGPSGSGGGWTTRSPSLSAFSIVFFLGDRRTSSASLYSIIMRR